MKKSSTICQAAIMVLTEAQKPLFPQEIYIAILGNALYDFKAKNPLGVLKSELRKHSVGVNVPLQGQLKYFQLLDDGSFWIKDKPLT